MKGDQIASGHDYSRLFTPRLLEGAWGDGTAGDRTDVSPQNHPTREERVPSGILTPGEHDLIQ